MSSVIIAGDVSGSVTLQAPATAGSTVVNLPSTLGNTGTSSFATTDASGNLGLGVAPSAWGSSYKALEVGGVVSYFSSANQYFGMYANAYRNSGGSYIYTTTGVSTGYIQDLGAHKWYNAASGTAGNAISFTQAMTLDSSGNLLVGGTTQTNSAKVEAFFSGASNSGFVANDTTSTSGTNYFIASNNGTNIGSIQRVGATSAVVYNTTSDQRLKSNIEDAAPVLNKLMQVQVRQYDWTEGDLHQDYGFIAQELQPVLTGVVTQGQTEEDVWQLDYSRLTPHLVKAIQEQQALITQLQADVAALKGQ